MKKSVIDLLYMKIQNRGFNQLYINNGILKKIFRVMRLLEFKRHFKYEYLNRTLDRNYITRLIDLNYIFNLIVKINKIINIMFCCLNTLGDKTLFIYLFIYLTNLLLDPT